jgi:hypothetical protein
MSEDGIVPRYNEDLDITYIIVRTGYNNRALSDLKCVSVMRDKMNYLSECQLEEIETSFIDEDGEYIANPEKSGEVYIVPPERTIRLLYTQHSGYTWIDNDLKDPIYYNGNDKEHVDNVRNILGVLANGSFVFELSENANIDFRYILNFSNELTEMKFCGFFHPSTLYDVQYYQEKKAIVFKYDTESG